MSWFEIWVLKNEKAICKCAAWLVLVITFILLGLIAYNTKIINEEHFGHPPVEVTGDK